MRTGTLHCILIAVLICIGCSDDSAPLRPSPQLPPSAEPSEVDMDVVNAADMTMVKAPPKIAGLSVRLAPWRSQFSPEDTPAIVVEVITDGLDPVDVTAQASFTLVPEGLASVSNAQTLTFSGGGNGSLTACYSNLCDRVHFIVNQGPPRLTVIEPAFGASLSGNPSAGIRVSGNAADDSDTFELRVNGTVVDVDADGAFETTVDAQFGMNSVTVEADDGISVERTVIIRDVLWSEQYAVSNPDGVALSSLAAIRVDQRLFDSNEQFTIPSDGGTVSVEGISEFIELLLSVIDVSQLLDPSDLFDNTGLGVSVDSLSLGKPSVDFEITASGLNLFLTLPEGRLVTRGILDLQGEALSLDGEMGLVLSARVGLDLSFDGSFTADIDAVDVALETLAPNYESPAVNAIIDLATPEIRSLVETEFSDILGELLGELVVAFVTQGVGSIFENLQGLEFNLTNGVIPAVENDEGETEDLTLRVSMIPTQLTLDANRMMVMDMDFEVQHNPIDVDYHIIEGCPVFSDESWTEIPSRGVGLSLRPAVLNCVLYSAWRQGLLNFQVPIPGNLSALVSEVKIDAYLPPLFRPSVTPNGYPFEMQFGSLLVSVKRNGSEAFDLYGITVRAGMGLDLQGGSLAVLLADLPYVRATLEDAGSDNPLPSSLLETTLISLVWEDMKSALLGGLDLSLGEVPVDLGDINQLSPRVCPNSASIAPVFDENVIFLEDRLGVEGYLRLALDLLPEGEACPDLVPASP